MTKTEVIHFMEKIKAYYQHFSMEDYVVNEWYDKLKKYELEDVYRKLDDHLKGDYREEIPKLHFITKYLTAPNEKKPISDSSIVCNICKKKIKLNLFEQHYDRCSSIDYIVRNRKKYFGEETSKESLWQLDDSDFETRYWKFCEKLYDCKNLIDLEKRGLHNAILTHYGYEPEWNIGDILSPIVGGN